MIHEPVIIGNLIVLFTDESNDEIQWRLARVTHDCAKHEKDKHKRQNRMLEAFGYAEKAVELNPNSPHCHRVMSHIKVISLIQGVQ